MENKGQYVWDFELLVQWSYDDSMDTADAEDYTVVAPTFEQALSKVKKLALSPSRKFTEEVCDEDVNRKPRTVMPIALEVLKSERGRWLDG